MKNRPFLVATGLLSIGAIYAFSRDASQAQPAPTPKVTHYVLKTDTSGPDTLAKWMKEGHTGFSERFPIKGQPGVMVQVYDPWKPLKFLKLEVSKPKPVKQWQQASSDEDVYAKFAIEMTAPDLKLPPPKKPDPRMGGYREISGFPTTAEIRILAAKTRPTPNEPWVNVNPDSQEINYSNINWSFDNNYTASPSWSNRGNILRVEDSIRCPGGGQWKLKVRFRGSISDFFSEKVHDPLWGFEKTFWVETQQPHNTEDGVGYPVGLHKSWVKGLSYATSPNGPWKPIPQRGQPGFPLKWSQNSNLYVRAEKKYPGERWPTDEYTVPRFTHGKIELSDTDTTSSYGLASRFSRLKELPRVAVLTPKQRLNVERDGEFVTVKTEAGNVATASIMVSGQSKLPAGLQSWDDLQKIVMHYGIGEYNDVQKIEGLTHQVQVLPGAPATIHFNVWVSYDLSTGQSITSQGTEELTLRDANGKILAQLPHNERGKYDLQVEKPGRYFVDVDVPGADGRPLHRREALRSDPRFASDISQRITLNVKPYKTTPVAASDLIVSYQPWQKSGMPNIWQRNIVPIARTASQTTFNFAIKPLAGYTANPQVSWLEVKPRMAIQYYRVLSPLPEGASRQMNVYDVQVKGHILEMSLNEYMRNIR